MRCTQPLLRARFATQERTMSLISPPVHVVRTSDEVAHLPSFGWRQNIAMPGDAHRDTRLGPAWKRFATQERTMSLASRRRSEQCRGKKHRGLATQPAPTLAVKLMSPPAPAGLQPMLRATLEPEGRDSVTARRAPGTCLPGFQELQAVRHRRRRRRRHRSVSCGAHRGC